MISLEPLTFPILNQRLFNYSVNYSNILKATKDCYPYFFPFYFRATKKLKSQSDSSLLSELRSNRKEKIVEVDGTVTTQPVLQHIGITTWPGKLVFFRDI